jgi:hypothetical protein
MWSVGAVKSGDFQTRSRSGARGCRRAEVGGMKLVEIIVTASRSNLIQKCNKYVGLGYKLCREDLGAQPQVELDVENFHPGSENRWERLEILFYSK